MPVPDRSDRRRIRSGRPWQSRLVMEPSYLCGLFATHPGETQPVKTPARRPVGHRTVAHVDRQVRHYPSAPAVLAVGLVAAVAGSVIAHVVGVADTPGPDWTELMIQASLCGIGLTILAIGYAKRARKLDRINRDAVMD